MLPCNVDRHLLLYALHIDGTAALSLPDAAVAVYQFVFVMNKSCNGPIDRRRKKKNIVIKRVKTAIIKLQVVINQYKSLKMNE